MKFLTKPLVQWLLQSNVDFLSLFQRSNHGYIVGQPGVGKSRALESFIVQDILAGHGVGVVDPHGELYEHLVWRLSLLPDVWERVILVDPTNPKWTVSFNPLQAISDFSQERLSLFLTDVVVKIWGIDTVNAPRMIWLLTNTFLALSSLGLSLLELPRFLLDKPYRESLLPRLSHQGALAYFMLEFPQSAAGAHQWAAPVLNKIGGLIFDPDIRLMLSGQSTINFTSIINNNKVLLVNVPKGILGEGPSALLAAFIVSHLQKAALARAGGGSQAPFYLYLDEFQNYTTDNIKDILSESRKYHLSLILAHQYLDQLSSELRSAVLNTAGTLMCFRVGYQDAMQLAKEIFPSPDFLASFETRLKLKRFWGYPIGVEQVRQEQGGWDQLALELTKLNHREFWCRRRGTHTPTKHRTLEMAVPSVSAEVRGGREQLIDRSGELYGKSKSQVRQKAVSWDVLYNQLAMNGNSGHNGQPEEDIPQWGL